MTIKPLIIADRVRPLPLCLIRGLNGAIRAVKSVLSVQYFSIRRKDVNFRLFCLSLMVFPMLVFAGHGVPLLSFQACL